MPRGYDYANVPPGAIAQQHIGQYKEEKILVWYAGERVAPGEKAYYHHVFGSRHTPLHTIDELCTQWNKGLGQPTHDLLMDHLMRRKRDSVHGTIAPTLTRTDKKRRHEASQPPSEEPTYMQVLLSPQREAVWHRVRFTLSIEKKTS